MDEAALRLLAEVADLWNRVERRAKQVEQFRGEAIIACINEMRYAGRRIVDVLAHQNGHIADDKFNAVENLAIAKNYLINADHDLTDAVIFFAHRRLLRVIDEHGRTRICEHCPDFEELYPSIQEAQAIVSGSREDRTRRKEAYEKLASEYVPKIMDLHHRLTMVEALKVKDDAALAQVGFWVRITAGLSVVGSLASVIGVALAVWALIITYNPPIQKDVPLAEPANALQRPTP